MLHAFDDAVAHLSPAHENYAASIVDAVLTRSQAAGASDVHLVPTLDGLRMLWRIDGVLQPVTTFAHCGPNIVARLKVLAELLTYRTDVPQEGRLRTGDDNIQMRVSTFPTLYGEKAVIRLFVGSGKYQTLDDLGLPADILPEWRRLLSTTGGVLIVSGPAGSGKTTTLYASLREIIRESREERSLVSLEDPIEAVVPGVSQSQVNARRTDSGDTFDYARGLRSILRQDPEVIMVGEIRDRETAQTVFQAALSGHLVLTSFHAGSSAEAISRVGDMGIEPYLISSGLSGILSLRLLRRLCDECKQPTTDPAQHLGLSVTTAHNATGCDTCRHTGYSERLPLAELLNPNLPGLAPAILTHTPAAELETIATTAGLQTLHTRALQAIENGETSAMEVRRVFGVT